MDPALHEIYAKETAGHLTVIRKFIAACGLATAPYPVTEDLYRSCHTLSGTAKTAGARQGIRIADPLNRYIRKLYDNSTGLPAEGLDVLKDAVAAIQLVVDHINEDTGFFVNHGRVVARLNELEHALDLEIARLAETIDVGVEATRAMPALRDNATPPKAASAAAVMAGEFLDDPDAVTNVFGDEFPPVTPRKDTAEADVIELPSTDANELQMLEWSYENFPGEQPVELTLASSDETASVENVVYEDLAEAAADSGIVVEETAVAEELDEAMFIDGDIVVDDIEALAETNRVPVLGQDRESQRVPQLKPAVAEFAAEPEEIVIEMSGDEVTQTVALADASDTAATVHSVALKIVPPVEPEPAPQAEPEPVAVAPPGPPQPVAAPALISQPSPPPVVPVAPVPAPAAVVAAPEEEELDEDFDPDVAAIFSEEASELLETADSSLSAWARDRANKALVFELKRVLHTLKGGARMAGIRAMGDLSHELETLMELVEAGQVVGDQPVFDALQASLDALHRMRDTVSQGGRCVRPRELISRIRVLSGHEKPAPVAVAPAPAAVPAPAPVVAVAPAPEMPAPLLEAEPEPMVDETDVDESVEIEVEFGADELGAAAPRSAVRVEENPQALSQATLDVASVQPELPPDTPDAQPELVPAPALPPGREPQVQERQEFARVDADLLDNLLNNAGEVSIFRSRLEQQVGSIEFNLAELGRTVTRLKEQLRKLELETEAQILHRHQEEHPNRADFDPLELDRYSTIQQLTRAFAEAVSDVGSIEGLLENLTREGQNLLLQQARVVTELQNGLMRTRMVPFQRHVQRLSRLVRQVATDVGKRADLVVVGAAGELDRQVLDRMLPPFEHMLRNSIVHGIETPEERLSRGKPENGTIRVGLHRE
ncbi:MAG TPA: Hpt domain-containing protein, partial [Povalibacter sp.]|nr:Hpt domain-containing protein [Povalibacter sp.]